MDPQSQEQRTEEQKHPLLAWIRWIIISIVLLLIFVSTILWIIQGTQAVIPIAILTALGILFTFFQLVSSLFPNTKPKRTKRPVPQTIRRSRIVHAPSLTPSLSVVHPSPEVPTAQTLPVPIDGRSAYVNQSETRIDWGEAPHLERFYGREEEIVELQRWIVADSSTIVAILGMGGLGKTSLTIEVVSRLIGTFTYIFWRSLQNAPPLQNVLQDCLQFITNQPRAVSQKGEEDQISLLLASLHKYRCLIILDNIESILQSAHYRKGYEGYGQLFQRLGVTQHQSCLLLTSREKPRTIALLEGTSSQVKTYQLAGLGLESGQKILEEKGLRGAQQVREALITYYGGNPLALKLVSHFIQEVFDRDIAIFLNKGDKIFTDILDVLDQQFHRLSKLEQTVMYWLAVEREPISLDQLQEEIIPISSKKELQEALRSLLWHHLIERTSGCFTLQNVIMEYMTDRLVDHICKEILDEVSILLRNHALIKATTKNYIRESQIRIILSTVTQQLLAVLGKEEIENRCKRMLAVLRQTQDHDSYTAGNILNLLLQLGSNLRGYDFSRLTVRQAYLQGAMLPEVNFSYADLTTSIFTDTFGSIISVALSPDGTLLAAGTANHTVRVWNVASSIPLLNGMHLDEVHSVTFSPDSQLLASGSADQTIALWEMSTGRNLLILSDHTATVRSVAFSPDGRLLASGSEDNTVRLWDVRTGKRLSILQGHNNWIVSVNFSSDGQFLASASFDHTTKLWSTSTGECLATLQGHELLVSVAVFSPDGQLLASGGQDRTVRLWDVSAGHCLHTLHGHSGWIGSLVFGPDGRTVVSCSDDQTIRIWETSTGRCLRILQGHTHRVKTLAVSFDGLTIISGAEDQTIRFWEANTGRCFHLLQGYTNNIRSIAMSSNEQIIVSGGEDFLVRIWDVSTDRNTHTLRGHTSWIWSVSLSPNGQYLVSGSDDQTIRLWDVSVDRSLNVFSGHQSWVLSVAFSPDSRIIASSSEDRTVRLWETTTGRCLQVLQGHRLAVWSVAFNPNGRLLASSSADQAIRIWETDTGRCIHTLEGHTSWVWSCIFSPDGKILASGSTDQTIRLWDVNTGRCLTTLYGHTSLVLSLAFDPTGNILASSGADHTIRLWNINTGRCLATLNGHKATVGSVLFGSSGNILASGSDDGTIKLWDKEKGICLKTLASKGPYQDMNITNAKGLSAVQKIALKALGAGEHNLNS